MACCPKKAVKHKDSLEDIQFSPKYSEKPLTEKFYSKYENVDAASNLSTSKNVSLFASEIEARMKNDRRDHFYAPQTENQVYGWYDRFANQHVSDEADKDIMFFPLKVDDMMSILKKISFDMKRERDYVRI